MNYSLFGCAWGKDTTDNKELCLLFYDTEYTHNRHHKLIIIESSIYKQSSVVDESGNC